MTMSAKYPGKCGRCLGRIQVGEQIVWSKGSAATHESAAQCVEAKSVAAAKAAAPKVELNLKPVADFLNAAKARGLKWPNARFLAPQGAGEIQLSVAGVKSRTPGAIQVKVNGNWIGRVTVEGFVEGGSLAGASAMVEALRTIAADPAAAAKAYGALYGRCSFCNTALTDEGSVEVGYGPVCAKKWGLPHKAKGSPVLTALPEAVSA